MIQFQPNVDGQENEIPADFILRALLTNQGLTSFTADYRRAFGTTESCKLLGELVRTSTKLNNLSLHGVAMDGDGFEYIVKGLLDNPHSVLERLEVGSNVNLRAKGAELVTKLIQRGMPALTTLGIWGPGFTAEETAPIAQALALNDTITGLSVGSGYGITYPEGDGPLNHIIRALIPAQEGTPDHNKGRHNVTIRNLSLCYEYEKKLADHVVRLIQLNTSLQVLGLRHALFNADEWKEIFRSFTSNYNIHHLDLYRCGAGFDQAFDDLMLLLQTNFTIKSIQLASTQLEADGRASQVRALLTRNQRLSDYLDTLIANLTLVPPNIGRVFLCGSPRAGKTTLRGSMVRSQDKSWEKVKRIGPSRWFGNSGRTQGIEIRMLKTSGDKHIAIWDMAGQDEYHALHDSHYLFPDINQAIMFLFLYRPYEDDEAMVEPDPNDALERLKKELRYWLSFVNSNSRRTGGVLPKISVVLTHFDKVFKAKWFKSTEKYLAWAKPIVDELREDFRGKVEVHETVYAVDASATKDGQTMVDHVMVCFDRLFASLPKVPAACEKMNLVLSEWSVQHPFEPIIKSEKFFELCSQNVAELNVMLQSVPPNLPAEAAEVQKKILLQNQRAIKYYLHDVGCIIDFEESNCIVIDPNWLGQVFLGGLFRPEEKLHVRALPLTETGIVDGNRLEAYLGRFISTRKYHGFGVEDLIKLLEELEMCYESPTESMGGKEYFIPSALSDPLGLARLGKRQLHWTIQQSKCTPRHRGLRLQSTDQSRTFLSPGVFQRFQVHLQQFMFRENIRHYEIKFNLIVVKHDGMEMLVESSGDGGDYVDILVRSYAAAVGMPGSHKLFTNVVREFRSFCASRRGCPGVALQEAILRPECVEKLTLCAHRKTQAVLTEILKDKVIEKLVNEPAEKLDIWVDCAYEDVVTDKFILDKAYHHLFAAVPEANLCEAWVKANDMITLVDIKDALFKNRLSVSQQAYEIYQAVDELRVHRAIPDPKMALSSPGTMARLTARMPYGAHAGSRNQEVWQTYLNDMDKRTHLKISRIVRNLENTMDSIGGQILDALEEQQKILLGMVKGSMEDMQMLHRNLQIALVEKLDQVICRTDAEHSMPRIPYFTDTGVGLPQRIASVIKIGTPLKLHFMCEEPSRFHFVKEQMGLPIINLWEGKMCERLRPIMSISMKVLFILIKAGLHVAAGIGNAIPDFSSLDAAIPLQATTLAGESILNEVKKSSHQEATGDMIVDAWKCVQEVVGPLARAGQIGQHFQLFQVRYKSNYLTKHLSEERVYWVCVKCKIKAEEADQLDESFNQLDWKCAQSVLKKQDK